MATVKIGKVLSKLIETSGHKESVFYEYILTPEEEKQVIRNAVEADMKSAALKMSGLGYLPQSIEAKLGEIDFRGQIDEFKLLDKANVRKHWHLQEVKSLKEMRAKEISDRRKMEERCDAKYFFRLMCRSFREDGQAFIQDEFSNPYIKALCLFMSQDDRFESELGYNREKGLWVVGDAGLGKTKLIEAIAFNDLAKVKVVSMLTVADAVQSEGEYKLGMFEKVLLDDVGSEQPVVNHYGTKVNWVKEFMELYYARRRAFNRLLVTTNCDFKEIEDKYGYRVRSRVREMFNIIQVQGEDRRK